MTEKWTVVVTVNIEPPKDDTDAEVEAAEYRALDAAKRELGDNTGDWYASPVPTTDPIRHGPGL